MAGVTADAEDGVIVAAITLDPAADPREVDTILGRCAIRREVAVRWRTAAGRVRYEGGPEHRDEIVLVLGTGRPKA
ncbi:hypothetical protein [Streptomyces sp. NBC_00035]|uniref:hypothetical protein n=1 Tax=Streptomyces sp. NBC_00035 TaxID=2903614 RepID=UPI00324E7699